MYIQEAQTLRGSPDLRDDSSHHGHIRKKGGAPPVRVCVCECVCVCVGGGGGGL